MIRDNKQINKSSSLYLKSFILPFLIFKKLIDYPVTGSILRRSKSLSKKYLSYRNRKAKLKEQSQY